jgi:hypothetical protein
MTALALALACLLPPPDDEGDLFSWARKLDDLDLTWTWGEFFFQPSGQLDLEAFVFGDEAPGVHVEDSALRSDDYDRGDFSDSAAFAARLQLFLDVAVSDFLEASIELRIDGGSDPEGTAGARFEQAWIRWKADPAANLQLGKFAAPLGNFIPRSASKKNPLTTWPLAYDHVTSLTGLSDSPGTLVQTRDDPDIKDWYVPIWQADYGWGLMVHGGWKSWTWSAAVTNSAPATLPAEWDSEIGDVEYLNLYLRGAWAVDPSLTLGASWSRGPYEKDDAEGGPVPPGPPPPPGLGGQGIGDAGSAYQTLFGVDVQFMTGLLEVYAEAHWTRLETPLMDELDLWTWYVEGKYAITPALFGAARIAQMYFGRVEDGIGESHQWDRDVSRVEFGGGYFFAANLFLKATMQLNYHMGGREPNDHLLMIQVGLGF